jgi:hypothetical protein
MNINNLLKTPFDFTPRCTLLSAQGQKVDY